MTRDEETLLERQGASAAVAGCSWQSNPFLRRENMPAASGDSTREWAARHDAWQRGFENAGADDTWSPTLPGNPR